MSDTLVNLVCAAATILPVLLLLPAALREGTRPKRRITLRGATSQPQQSGRPWQGF